MLLTRRQPDGSAAAFIKFCSIPTICALYTDFEIDPQGIHGLVGIFAEETAVILRKSNIQKPVHGFNFPMLPR